MAKLVPNTQTGSLTDHQLGTDDTLIGLDRSFNTLFGDSNLMDGNSRCGDDVLIGGTTPSVIYGDAFEMDGNARGGNDTLTGNVLFGSAFYGDAFTMHDHAQGGND